MFFPVPINGFPKICSTSVVVLVCARVRGDIILFLSLLLVLVVVGCCDLGVVVWLL